MLIGFRLRVIPEAFFLVAVDVAVAGAPSAVAANLAAMSSGERRADEAQHDNEGE
jgi:hypothetical protein